MEEMFKAQMQDRKFGMNIINKVWYEYYKQKFGMNIINKVWYEYYKQVFRVKVAVTN